VRRSFVAEAAGAVEAGDAHHLDRYHGPSTICLRQSAELNHRISAPMSPPR
jgi:hypothetical protein